MVTDSFQKLSKIFRDSIILHENSRMLNVTVNSGQLFIKLKDMEDMRNTDEQFEGSKSILR